MARSSLLFSAAIPLVGPVAGEKLVTVHVAPTQARALLALLRCRPSYECNPRIAGRSPARAFHRRASLSRRCETDSELRGLVRTARTLAIGGHVDQAEIPVSRHITPIRPTQ